MSDLRKTIGIIGTLLLSIFKVRGNKEELLVSRLSERETQVCDMMLKIHTTKSISLVLSLSESTIITYKKEHLKILNINQKYELVKFI